MTLRKVDTVKCVLTALLVIGGGSACTASGGTAAGGMQLVKNGALTVCTTLPYAPYEIKKGNKVVGFDPDMMDLVAKELDVRQRSVDTPFENIQSGEALNAGQCDIAASGMAITAERKQRLDYSRPYSKAAEGLLTKKNSGIRSFDDLDGKRVGVQSATASAEFANKHLKDSKIVTFDDIALVMQAVKTGNIDAGINDYGVFYDFTKSNPDTEVAAQADSGYYYGFGVKKGNTELADRVNKVIVKAAEDGDYSRIYRKWFGKKPSWTPDQPAETPAPAKG